MAKMRLLRGVNECRQCSRKGTNVGSAVAVTKAFFFRLAPPRVVYARLEAYPPMLCTISTCPLLFRSHTIQRETRKSSSLQPTNPGSKVRGIQVKQILRKKIRRNLRFGDVRIPRVIATMAHNWEPFPIITDSNRGFFGERKTSPATSFQPQSSCTSSCYKHECTREGIIVSQFTHAKVNGVVAINLRMVICIGWIKA